MEHFWSNGLSDLYEVSYFLGDMFGDFIDNIYESESSWLFLFALMIPLIALVFDIYMSFILSMRFREIRVFNIFSSRSWKTIGSLRNASLNRVGISDTKLHPRDYGLRRFTLTPFAFRLRYKKAKAGDIIYCKDGLRSQYAGLKLHADGKTILYKYRTANGLYFSRLKPYEWSNTNGSQRMESIMHYKKNK